MQGLKDLIANHYGKLVTAVVVWTTEALFDLSSYIKALLP